MAPHVTQDGLAVVVHDPERKLPVPHDEVQVLQEACVPLVSWKEPVPHGTQLGEEVAVHEPDM